MTHLTVVYIHDGTATSGAPSGPLWSFLFQKLMSYMCPNDCWIWLSMQCPDSWIWRRSWGDISCDISPWSPQNPISSVDFWICVSQNRGTPKSSIWIGCFLINQAFCGSICGNPRHLEMLRIAQDFYEALGISYRAADRNLLSKPSDCWRGYHGMSWDITIQWEYHRNIMGISWEYHGKIMSIAYH